MQTGHMLWPYGILALQKAHAADASLFLALARVSNRYRKGRMAIKNFVSYIGATRIFGRFDVL